MTNEDKLKIWRNMTPAQRDYDRKVAKQIPAGASWEPETSMNGTGSQDQDQDRGCYCHIVAPCSVCTESDTEPC